MKETLLINPPYTDYFESPHFAPSRPNKETSTVSVPLGLAYIASFLREQNVPVQCLDLEVEPKSLVEIAEKINAEGIQVVGLTATTPLIEKAIKIGRYLKENTKALLVLGGVHASAEPLETAELDVFDAVVVGEGELPMRDICMGIEPKDVPGVVANGKINPRYELIQNLDELVFPAFDLFPEDEYHASLHRDIAPDYEQPYYTAIGSRGCPYNCRFCYSKGVFLYRVRDRGMENILDEIEGVVNARKNEYPDQPVKIMFYDDTFTLKRKRILEFCEGVKKRGLNIVWGCNTRVNHVDPEMLSVMKEAGCKRVYVGVENGNDEFLAKIDKKLTKEQIRRGVAMIKESGIEISASYVIGVPEETRASIQNTIEFAKELNTDYAHFYAFTPDPGSPFYVELKAKGIIQPHDWENYDVLVRKGTLALGENISWEEIVASTKRAYREYYSRKEWDEMRRKKIKTPGETKQHELLLQYYSR
jgi:radical SAM superfamily enzyme YgiQ (UPF0313 family)